MSYSIFSKCGTSQLRIDAVAGEAAAEMIVDSALRDVRKSKRGRVERIGEAVAQTGAPQKREEDRLRKFRCAVQAAVDPVDELQETAREIGERRVVELGAGATWRFRREAFLDEVCVVADGVVLLAIDARDVTQYTDECRPAIAGVLGKIGAAPERLGVSCEEHSERPAALLAELVQRAHVDGIDIRSLLAVDFDVDEQLVHHGSRCLVLEALMRHDVAPMAGGVTDREQDRFAAGLGLRQRLRPPGSPMHRVVLVLEQIRARLQTQPVPGKLIFSRTVFGMWF